MMKRTPQAQGRYGYGMGYFAETLPGTSIALAGHRGANTGWHAIFTVNPETNDGLIMVTNGGDGHNVYGSILYDWTLWETGVKLEDWHIAKPSIAKKLKSIIEGKGIEDIAAVYAELKKNHSERYDFDELRLNELGYDYMAEDELEKALAVLKLNVELFPDAWNVYDSYGEALLKQGAREEAIANYKKSVELNPLNQGGVKVLNDLGIPTEYSIPWSPKQATGAPDTPQGDHPTAWTSMAEDGGAEWLKLTYAKPVDVAQVRVHETDRPGAIIKVTADVDGEEVAIWSGEKATAEASRWLELTPTAAARTATITLHLDTSLAKGWNQIDAVELVGADGSRQWAEQAEASSYFGDPAFLQQGNSGPEVSAIQKALNEKLNPSPGLAVDGMFGPATKAAVMQFQERVGLKVDGAVGQETKAALEAASTPTDETD